MEWVNLVVALVLPLLLGATCIGLVIHPATPGRPSLVWGNGMLLGLFLTPLVMRLQDALGISLTFSVTALALSALLLLVFPASRRRDRTARANWVSSPRVSSVGTAEKCLFVILVLLIASRVMSVGLELLWRPLFPWDATMHWASKARVWFDAGEMVPFVDNQRWLERAGEGVFTDHHPDYPATIPLLQVWINGALGRWDESLMNLPWWQCMAGLGAAFYGQARAAGSRPLPSLVFTYLLLSMPLLNIHVALAGYADLFQGAAYCAALMAFHNWSLTKDRGQALIALVFALFCPLVKNEGLFWLLTFLPAIVVVSLPPNRVLPMLVAGFVVLGVVLLLFPQDTILAGHSLGKLKLQFRPEAIPGMAASIWVQDNWHLLGYLLAGLFILSILADRDGLATIRGIGTALLAAICLWLVLFMFSRYAQRVGNYTAVGRISLHLAPGLMFLSCLLWNRLSNLVAVGAQTRSADSPRAG